jgi:hypothetical protein
MKYLRMIKQAFVYLWNMIFNRGSIQFDVYSIGASDVKAMFNLALPTATVTLLDWEYAFTTLKSWQKIIDEMMKDMNPYKKDVHDCDDFASFLSGHVSNDYKLNGCLTATGKDDTGGAHAFNVIIYQGKDKVEFTILEPQTGVLNCKYAVSTLRG